MAQHAITRGKYNTILLGYKYCIKIGILWLKSCNILNLCVIVQARIAARLHLEVGSSWRRKIGALGHVNPNVAKAGGLQSQGAKGAAVVDLLQALGNTGSGVLRISRRVKKMA
jgi:hypothetical protein